MSYKQGLCSSLVIGIVAFILILGCSENDFFDPNSEGSINVIIKLHDYVYSAKKDNKSLGSTKTDADIMAIDRVRVIVRAHDISPIIKECTINGTQASCSIEVAAGTNRNICVEVYESNTIIYCGSKNINVEGGKTNNVTITCFARRDSLRNDDNYPTSFFSDIEGELCYYASRFTPELPCTLKWLYTEFYTPTDSQFVAQICSIFVWNNSQDNTPGQLVYKNFYDIQDTIYPEEFWIYGIDISSQGVTFESDFWLGIKMNDLHAPYHIADGTTSPPKRNMLKCPVDNIWYSYTNGDFFIYTSVLYQCCGEYTSSAGCSESTTGIARKKTKTADRMRILK